MSPRVGGLIARAAFACLPKSARQRATRPAGNGVRPTISSLHEGCINFAPLAPQRVQRAYSLASRNFQGSPIEDANQVESIAKAPPRESADLVPKTLRKKFTFDSL